MSESVKTGRCNCGAVRYEVSGQPTWSAGCCCRDCARATGTPFVVWVGFPPDHVAFTSSEPRVHCSSEGVLRGYCDECGTSLTYGRDAKYDVDEPLLYVAAATLDDPAWFPPTEVVWYAQRPSWLNLSGDIPLHEGVSAVHADRAYNAAMKRN